MPEGTWFNLWTKEAIQGPNFIEVSATMGEIPVFIKANSAILFNLDHTKQIGSWVGNDVTEYDTPVCKIFYQNDFGQTITDHLGNKIAITVEKQEDTLVVKVNSSLDHLEIEVFGIDSTVEIEQV